MKRTTRVSAAALIAGLAAFGLGTLTASADHDRGNNFRARLAADNEVPIVISDARGRFSAELDDSGAEPILRWKLSYEGLEGTVTQGHIHIGQPFASGGISLWFCANNPPITNAPAGTPTCPQSVPEDTPLEGTFTASNVVGPTNQAVPAGAFADALEAIKSGNAYVNVHSTSATGGEIRGQIRRGRGDRD